MRNWLFVPFVSLLFTFPAFATEVHVLSAGAVEPALVVAADAFHNETGNEVRINYATSPEIRRRIGAGETADVVIAPPAVLDEVAKSGKLDSPARVELGRVGIGIAVRDGLPKPDISTIEAFKRAVLDGSEMFEHVIKGQGNELAFSPITEILLYRGKGLQLVGPLPPEIQNFTAYAAEPAASSEVALAFVHFLGTPAAKAIFVAAGVE